LAGTFQILAVSRKSHGPTLQPAPARDKITLEEHLSDLEADSPIESASQDLLNRSELVESFATMIVVSQAPVIAIEGDYGDGKSSVLNLLRERLAADAIVVSFKTWLPKSEDTLVRDLFNDIYTECRRSYYVPQLRSRLVDYAKTITGSISPLRALSDIMPATSQRAEIADLGQSLLRIPRRVVVLLDEMDRLQMEELRVLLKVIRGVTSFANLSYVCAFSRKAIEKMSPPESAEALEDYYEKFFPVSCPLPKPEGGFLLRVLKARLDKVFDPLDCFESPDAKVKFQKRLTEVWEDALSKVLTNLRKITLVINSVSVAVRPISREINTFDLTIVETLRRFFPEVYEHVRRNGGDFVGVESSWGSRLYSADQVKAARKQLFDRLIKELYAKESSKPAADMLWWLFPEFAERLSESVGRSRIGFTNDTDLAEREKRISHEDFFPIYFGYRVPESLYSEAELSRFLKSMNGSRSTPERKALFAKTLAELPKADPRRLSFLHRLLHSVGRLNEPAAEALSETVAECASEYSYDSILPSEAEAGKAMLIVFEVAQRFAQGPKAQQVLERAIEAATDDTLALRLLTFSLNPERNKVLKDFSNVHPDVLKSVFVQRMQKLYVERFDTVETSLAQADRGAFVMWAGFSDKERQSEIGFWRRYVGTNRKRLARMCDILFPPGAIWEADPSPHIERLFPLEELKKLDDKLPTDQALEEFENRALNRMRKLIAGEFQHGVGFDDLQKV
jgi:KAP-like P-loop domain-containing protein